MLDLHCNICDKKISVGEGHVAITYNVEYYKQRPATLDLYAKVISAQQIFTMCGDCANKRSANKIDKILTTTLQLTNPQLN